MKVTNTQKGPRGLNTKAGPVLVEPGQTVDVEMESAEIEVSKKTGWFDFGKAKAVPEPAGGGAKTYDEMTRAELDALAAERGVDASEAKNKGDVIAALQLADEAAA